MTQALRRSSIFALGLAALLLLPACAQGGGGQSKAEIEQIVREYILANPEIIEEALIALTEKERAQQASAARSAITDNRDKLYNLASDYSVGPADAPITVVEFFDYRCGFCKRSAQWVADLPETYNGQVRVVFKELPIFGGISETAALAALAAGRQDRYLEMHLALMSVTSNDDLTEAKIDELAGEIGINVQQMRADMASQQVKQQLAEMQALGRALSVGGTPGFFIGDEVIEGANMPRIEQVIEAQLES